MTFRWKQSRSFWHAFKWSRLSNRALRVAMQLSHRMGCKTATYVGNKQGGTLINLYILSDLAQELIRTPNLLIFVKVPVRIFTTFVTLSVTMT